MQSRVIAPRASQKGVHWLTGEALIGVSHQPRTRETLSRLAVGALARTLFRIRATGSESVPDAGPALLVATHLSHCDGLLIAACLRRPVRLLVWKPYYELRAVNWLFRLARAIPVGPGEDEIATAIRAARQALAAGEIVCISAEGAVSRTGAAIPFQRGLVELLKGLDVLVIPVHLDRMLGTVMSFERDRFSWSWPRRIPTPVAVRLANRLERTPRPIA